ncbi:hypothetical protein ZIOFF_028221 [Zingiber officinale]|uniref:GLTSCR protein conserved domain-containing protein n=1 Tax=Zingiber officinale TaxID=94328 RepID=A0A8J5GL05_ZINOF|nr:hypothetical protein ZIOFF_028221 [Zingiber officinale]
MNDWLLPYHVVSDYEAEEDDRILDSDTTGQIFSRIQQWDNNILAKIAEFATTFEKQVLAFDIMTQKRAQGEFRSEERLMIEQALLQEEKQALLGIRVRAELESKENAGREAAEAKVQVATAQVEHARAEAQERAEMYAHASMRVGSAALSEAGPGLDIVPEQGGNMDKIHQWGNAQREDEEPSEDFLNDENEPENRDTGTQGEWREAGKLDLNSRIGCLFQSKKVHLLNSDNRLYRTEVMHLSMLLCLNSVETLHFSANLSARKIAKVGDSGSQYIK